MKPDPHTSSHAFETSQMPTWCPGCGNFALWTALNHVFAAKKWQPHEVVVAFDIGCSGNASNWVKAYTFHGLHGRSVPLGVGIKLANHKLKTIIVSGDGAAYGEGISHLIHTIRANPDITYLVEDNQLYALTKGQASPTSAEGYTGESTPYGSPDEPLNPIALALAADASFVARGFAGDLPHLESLITQALDHTGFSFIDAFQPCVTFNKLNTYAWFFERVRKLEDMKYIPNDRARALEQAWATDYLPIGVFYQSTRHTLEQRLPQLQKQPLVNQALKPLNMAELINMYS